MRKLLYIREDSWFFERLLDFKNTYGIDYTNLTSIDNLSTNEKYVYVKYFQGHVWQDMKTYLSEYDKLIWKKQKEYDIKANVKENNDSVTKLAIQNKITNKWTIPYVIEPSAGVDRGVLAVLNEAYKVEKLDNGKERTVLALKPHLSPIKAAIIPLKRNNEDLVSKALSLKKSLQSLRLGRVLLDNSGNIGKSYRRHDEIGTPMCITIDFQTLEDDSVTIRDRDSMEQIRLNIAEVSSYFQSNLL